MNGVRSDVASGNRTENIVETLKVVLILLQPLRGDMSRRANSRKGEEDEDSIS